MLALLLACGLLAGATTARADGGAAHRIGVNRVNLAWLSRDEQETILRRIAESGVTDIRMSLSRPVDKSIEALEIADRLGLRILLEIQLTNKSYYPPEATPRTGFGRVWDIHRLSDLDLDLYRAGIGDALRRIDGLGIRLAAVEPGNEINYSAFNGDLRIHPRAGTPTPRDAGGLENRAAFERGLDAYVEAVRITRDALRKTTHSREALIVSAGLSDISARLGDKRGMERLDPGEVIALLRRRGLDEVVDAYGIHIYPGDRSAKALEKRITGLLDFCQPTAAGKPCWVTEWGIANDDRACPVDDRRRVATIRAVQTVFDTLIQADRLKAAFYYDWDTQSLYSLWRCGGLSPAGAAVLRRQGE